MIRSAHALALCVFTLLVLGTVMVSSAGLTVGSGEPLRLTEVLFARGGAVAFLAMALMLVSARMPVRAIGRARGILSPPIWIIGISLLLLLAVHVPGLGHEVNGARRWLRIGPIGFQPSELAKWGVPIALAWYVVRHRDRMNTFLCGFAAPMFVVGIVCATIALEDLGTAVLIAVVAAAVLVAAGGRILHLVLTAPIGAVGVALALVQSPYRLDRLRAFIDPYQDPQGIGYHILQSLAAISGGGLTGRGLGNGVQKFGYLPEDTTDFIFAIIAEELGLVGIMVVLCLYAGLFLAARAIIRESRDAFSRVLGLGVILTLATQALINMLVVTGLAPTKGIALPLISSGGTGWCLTGCAMGLLMAISRESTCEADPRDAAEGLEWPPTAAAVHS